jgi:hypothetical protein
MERFFSPQNIERYRKLRDISTGEPERRMILKSLSGQELAMRSAPELKVRVEPRGNKYIWELRRAGRYQPVKFSAPLYLSKETAGAFGNEARTLYIARLAARR